MGVKDIVNIIKHRVGNQKHPTVFVCGFAGAGKTTFCKSLINYLPRGSIVFRLDLFTIFGTQERLERMKAARQSGDPKRIAKEENPYNWHDLETYLKYLAQLRDSGSVSIHNAFNQSTGKRDLHLQFDLPAGNSIILGDGIYLLHPEARVHASQTVLLDVPFATCIERVESRDGHRSSKDYLDYKTRLREQYDVPYLARHRSEADMVLDYSGTQPVMR